MPCAQLGALWGPSGRIRRPGLPRRRHAPRRDVTRLRRKCSRLCDVIPHPAPLLPFRPAASEVGAWERHGERWRGRDWWERDRWERRGWWRGRWEPWEPWRGRERWRGLWERWQPWWRGRE
ncbi:hypothetical protein Nmel_015107 [Mimus melanotis]